MDVTVDPMPLDALVELVNGWGTRPREAGRRPDEPSPQALAGRLGVPSGVVDELTGVELRRLADALFPVFSVDDPAKQVARVAGLLQATAVRPDLRLVGGQIEATWLVPDPQHAVTAAAALSLRDQLSEHHPGRLGVCRADTCADVYIDSSPGAHRRFCSLTCQNRVRVAAFRKRRKASG